MRLYGRIVQVAAMIAFVAMLYIDKTSAEQVSDWMYGVMLGIAAGANPDDFSRFFGRKE